MNRNLPIAIASLTCLLTLGLGSAQAQSATFSAVFPQVKPGETLRVTDANGQQFTGKLEDATATSLKLSIGGATREFQAANVQKVARRDSAKNGAVIGFGIGAVPGVLFGTAFATYCTNEASSCPAAPLSVGVTTGLVGAWIGYAIDRHLNRVLFASAPTSRSTTVRVAPVIARDRRGMTVSLAF